VRQRWSRTPWATGRRTFRPLLERLEDRTAPAVFTVTSANDPFFPSPGDGSLREAIIQSNAATPGPNGIIFNIPSSVAGTTIQINIAGSALPAITTPVRIDGTTEATFQKVTTPGPPLILLNGAFAGFFANGLNINVGGCTVLGLTINSFALSGINIKGSNATGNQIVGDFLGTNATGSAAAKNFIGISIIGGASNNTIGGVLSSQFNTISGNTFGVDIENSNTTGNLVEGNFIGTTSTGTASLPNLQGVRIDLGASGNMVGGLVIGNLIAGNTQVGVELTGSGTTANIVENNFIGINNLGTVLPNGDGVAIDTGATGNTVGGTALAARNVISGNSSLGIGIADVTTTGNVVEGNFIGTNVGGTAAAANPTGVVIDFGASANTIGGTAAAARNIISGNSNIGVDIADGNTTGNVVEGNFIGTDVSGSTAVANLIGVKLEFGTVNNLIGTPGAGNVISGNATGIDVQDGSTMANLVQGNFVGTNNAGTAAIPNGFGVEIQNGATNNTIGGTDFSAGNVISGNTGAGIVIASHGTTGNLVQGNAIGTNLRGTGIMPNGNGVVVESQASGNFIGSTLNGSAGGNIIAYNTVAGVEIGGTATDKAVNNAVLSNFIFGNGGLGIDLGADGVTANGSAPRTGPNNFQNYPVLTGFSSNSRIITGTLGGSLPNSLYRIEFFGSASVDASGHGQGQDYLGFVAVRTDNSGNAAFSFNVVGPTNFPFISTTATDPNGNTSEFSDAPLSVTLTMGPATEGVAFSGGVAQLTDSDPKGSNFTAVINWGDGTTSPASTAGGTIVPGLSNTFQVLGSHTFVDESATNIVTVTVTDAETASGNSAAASLAIAVADAPLTMGNATVAALAGVAFNGILGSLSDAGDISDLSATILWGDGTTTAGTLTSTGSGSATVSGMHTYAQAGSYSLQVKVADQGGASVTAFDNVTVAPNATATHFSVSAPASAAAGAPFTITVTALDSTNHVVPGYLGTASFTSSDALATLPAKYTFTGGDSGSHQFAGVVLQTAGSQTLTATDTVTAAITGSATVVARGLTALSRTPSFAEGIAATAVVASFTDADPLDTPGDYTASIQWGDGSKSSGAIVPNAAGFDVSGTHTYAEEGSDAIVVTIQDVGAESAIAHSTATVAGGVVLQGLGNDIIVFGHKNFSGTLATFTDPDSIGTTTPYAATIAWGDGTTSAGTITLTTVFTVSGSHTYAAFTDTKQITITVTDNSGAESFAVTDTAVDPPFPGSPNQLYVAQLYHDLLHRAADDAGLAYWSGQLDQGASRTQIALAITSSDEYRGDLVEGLYSKYLRRQADAGGLAYFTNQLARGATAEAVAAQITGSDEYFHQRGGGTTAGFLTALYEDALGRAVDPTGQAAFGGLLAQGVTRDQVAAAIFSSGEYRQDLLQADYQALLLRPADATGLAVFGDALAHGVRDEAILALMAGSGEYFQRL
jgi:hypothetical protein